MVSVNGTSLVQVQLIKNYERIVMIKQNMAAMHESDDLQLSYIAY